MLRRLLYGGEFFFWFRGEKKNMANSCVVSWSGLECMRLNAILRTVTNIMPYRLAHTILSFKH